MVVLAGTLNGEQVSMIIDLQFGSPLSKLKGSHCTEPGASVRGRLLPVNGFSLSRTWKDHWQSAGAKPAF